MAAPRLLPGITNISAIGAGGVEETLVSTSDTPVIVNYMYTLNDSGCINMDTVMVSVNPIPQFTSSVKDTAICDSIVFTYLAMSNVSGATFAWSRADVPGIANTAASGTGNASEELVNTTNDNVLLTYVYTATANGCSSAPVTIPVTVHPTPKLSSSLTAVICNGFVFSYVPASYTDGTTFDWKRDYVAGVGPGTSFGTGSVHEILYDSAYAQHTVVYTTGSPLMVV